MDGMAFGQAPDSLHILWASLACTEGLCSLRTTASSSDITTWQMSRLVAFSAAAAVEVEQCRPSATAAVASAEWAGRLPDRL